MPWRRKQEVPGSNPESGAATASAGGAWAQTWERRVGAVPDPPAPQSLWSQVWLSPGLEVLQAGGVWQLSAAGPGEKSRGGGRRECILTYREPDPKLARPGLRSAVRFQV